MNIDAMLKPFIWVYRGIVLVSIFVYRTLKGIFKSIYYVLVGINKISILIYSFLRYVLIGIGVFVMPLTILIQNGQKKVAIKNQKRTNKIKKQTEVLDKKKAETKQTENVLVIQDKKEDIINEKQLKKQKLKQEQESKREEIRKQKQINKELKNTEEKNKLEEKIMAKKAKEQLKLE